MNNHSDLSAYFLHTNQPTSSNEVLFSFRFFYPNSQIYLISDNNQESVTLLAQKYYCKYYHDHHLSHSLVWIQNLLKYIRTVKDKWLIILCDDTLVLKHINLSNLKYDINGEGSGGIILRVSFFQKLNIVDGGTDFSNKELLLSLTRLNGGTIGNYDEYHTITSNLIPGNIWILDGYKGLYDYPHHPNLLTMRQDKYTIILPTRGNGLAFDIFIEVLLPRYLKYLNLDEIYQFIIICPKEHLALASQRIFAVCKKSLFLVFYADEEIVKVDAIGWIKQQTIKLAICHKVKTEYYLIIDDDLIITKSLDMADFFDDNRIVYSYEAYPSNGPNFATNTNWWTASAIMNEINPNILKSNKDLMGVTPQLMITRIVHQMLYTLGAHWINKMCTLRATEYTLYWIYLMRSLRTGYYIPNNKLFAMDHEVNVLVKDLTQEQIKNKINKGITEQKYVFIVAQSWLNYPKSWITNPLIK
jgi:hypothetical protein